MNPRVAVLLLLTASCGNPPAPETQSPNVVYILSDTHRWGAMSFTQTPAVQTPNLERLAREGVSFNRRYVNLPICTPDRAIFLTGRWPYQQGLIANHMALAKRVDLPEGERHRGTLAWAFKNAGYTTALLGKWHLGGNTPEGKQSLYPDEESLPFHPLDEVHNWESHSWMDMAETPYADNWFEKSPVWEIQAWNREHGFGESSDDREIGRRDVFDLSASEPK